MNTFGYWNPFLFQSSIMLRLKELTYTSFTSKGGSVFFLRFRIKSEAVISYRRTVSKNGFDVTNYSSLKKVIPPSCGPYHKIPIRMVYKW